uniref:Uncharacterized protein n=1 Tax=Amphimedon queenslandica TaxID=400682 RepID=A0A1X7V988_AMPQE
MSALFGIGCSTVCTIVIKTCEKLSERLFHKYIYMPTGEGLQKTKGIEGSLLPCLTRKLESVDAPLVTLGDAANPLFPWLMKPNIETPSSLDDIKLCNYRQSWARMVVKTLLGD